MKNLVIIICLVLVVGLMSGCRSLCSDCGPSEGLFDGARDSVMMVYNGATIPVNLPSLMIGDTLILPLYNIDEDSWVWP